MPDQPAASFLKERVPTTTMMVVSGKERVTERLREGSTTGDIKSYLSLVILLADRAKKAVEESESFENEWGDVVKQVDELSDVLHKVLHRVASTRSPYDRPVRCILDEASKGFERALNAASRCRRAGLFRRVVTITTRASDFKKANSLLEASIANLSWLLSIFPSDKDEDEDGGGGGGGGIMLSLPPIASTDPILAFVWSCVASLQMGRGAKDRTEAAHYLANLALDNDRNKKIIIEEGGIQPLLSLLKDSCSLDVQLAAALAISELANEKERVGILLGEQAVPVIVETLGNAPMRLQIELAKLIARMASYHDGAQDEFARENAIRPLVSLLSFEVQLDESKPVQRKPTSIHSLVQINRDLTNSSGINSDGSGSGSSRGTATSRDHLHQRKEKENEAPETKLQLKIACANALWKLSKGCAANSRKITETKGLLCLAKLIEKEKGELQYNCLMTIVEIAAVAETDADLRRSAFKMNSPAAKSVVDQLLRVVSEGTRPSLQIPAIKAIGSLAHTFPARKTRVLKPVVEQLGLVNSDVAAEAARALAKFVNPHNFLHQQHSMAIIEFGGVPLLMRLLRAGEKTQLPGLILLCYLASHGPNVEALERVKALNTLESVARTAVAQDGLLRDLLSDAIYNLELYRVGPNTNRHLNAV